MPELSPQFRDFLVQAKRNTYASGSPLVSPEPFLESSRQLQYSSGNYLYRDIYFGSEQFSGMEVVYEGKEPVWTMVYRGGINASTGSREIYAFLKRALRGVSVDFPARGPRIFREGVFTYENNYQGSLENFQGDEDILISSIEVYRLSYYGSVVRRALSS